MHATIWMPTLALCAVLATEPYPVEAQAPRRELVGIVRDPAGAPIEGATVEIIGASVRTNARGAFQLWTGDTDTVTIAIRRIGYVAVEALLRGRNRAWDTLAVELEPTTTRLPGVRVTEDRIRGGLAGFAERRAKGHGVFVDRAEIAAQNTMRLTDILRARRGINIVRIGPSRFGVRFATYSGTRGASCPPDVWLDGQRARGLELDDLFANTVEAMELYDTFATLPVEFSHSAGMIPCGTIVIWTRVPSKPDKP